MRRAVSFRSQFREQAGAAETMAETQEEVVEFTALSHVRKVVAHAGRLARPRPRRLSVHSLVGPSTTTAPDTPSANSIPDEASDQAR